MWGLKGNKGDKDFWFKSVDCHCGRLYNGHKFLLTWYLYFFAMWPCHFSHADSLSPPHCPACPPPQSRLLLGFALTNTVKWKWYMCFLRLGFRGHCSFCSLALLPWEVGLACGRMRGTWRTKHVTFADSKHQLKMKPSWTFQSEDLQSLLAQHSCINEVRRKQQRNCSSDPQNERSLF